MAAATAENGARHILEIAEGFMKSQVLFTGMKLGIFDLLGTSSAPMTTMGIAEGIGADTDATKRLLDACVGLRLLQKVNMDKETGNGEYQLTKASKAFLTSSSSPNLGDWLGRLAAVYSSPWADLPRAVKEGPNFCTLNGFERGKTFEDLYSTAQYFMGSMEGLTTVFGAGTASAFNLAEFQNICDIGGCTGPLAYHLAAAYPEASVSVFDLPEVVKIAEDRRPTGEYAQRVSFISGDFFQDPLPPADLYVVCRILHDWTEDKVLTLLTKLYDSLPQGGGVLIVEHILTNDKLGPEVAHKYDLHMMVCTGGRQRSGQEFKRLLSSVGFTEVTVKNNTYPFGYVLARKQRV
ncbi:acetylserotonin O-methyltransferase-like [Branchiostoma floridae]|uniref:Acetylserotonin O-methyltransferase n=1 Tax=Branchiostoma floridae TaxID=7739 RepID=A0A9J7HPS2_BRAFL|nr:acetylserotonin O-methyltransferase-like [Branchiostoma floridae]